MINTQYKEKNTSIKNMDKHNNMLIIGEGKKLFRNGKICRYTSPEEVEKLYGKSDLSESFRIAKEIGVKDVFVLNAINFSDYVECLGVISHHDFTYIVPVGVKFSDIFFDYETQESVNFPYSFLKEVSQTSDSIYIMTDEHASLYEDMDHYLIDIKEKVEKVKQLTSNISNGHRVCLVANNLENYQHANLVLASVLCTTPLGDYPKYNFGEAIFDIDEIDTEGHNFIYFKNNMLVDTSIENARNIRNTSDALKDINICRVVTYILRELDLSEYKGKMYNDNIKLSVYNLLSRFLQNIMGTAIRGYEIKQIYFEPTQAGEGTLHLTIYIIPVNSIEGFNLVVKI